MDAPFWAGSLNYVFEGGLFVIQNGVHDGALQRDAHQTWRALSFTAAFHGALEQSKSHQQTAFIKVPPPYMLQEKNHTDVLSCLHFSYHVSVNRIK